MDIISTKGKAFVDNFGRERIFNGINVCDKGRFNGIDRDFEFEWEEERFEAFKKSGINAIRLGITWEAIEPLPGLYNEAYLNALEKILDKCAENGIYAFIDMHQDLYSGFGDGPGDGAPKWACLTGKHKYRKPFFIWGESYVFSKAVKTAFDNFWNNELIDNKGVQDYYRDMWLHVAKRFHNHPSFLGFDLMNEPFPGSSVKNVFKSVVCSIVKTTLTDKRIPKKELISRLLKKSERIHVLDFYTAEIIQKIMAGSIKHSQDFEKGDYTSFLEKTAKHLRDFTDRGIFFVEPGVLANAGIPSAVKPLNINGKREAKQAYSPHGYDLMVDTEYYKYANNERVAAVFAQKKTEQDNSLDMPVLVGEWGGNAEGTEWLPHVEFLLSLFDEYKWSHTYWCYYEGIIGSPLMNVLSRPYPQAVSGNIISYKHEREKNIFTLEYDQASDFDAPTEIFAPFPVEYVKTSGEYSIKELTGTSSIISIKTEKGRQSIEVKFKGEGFSYKSEK